MRYCGKSPIVIFENEVNFDHGVNLRSESIDRIANLSQLFSFSKKGTVIFENCCYFRKYLSSNLAVTEPSTPHTTTVTSYKYKVYYPQLAPA